MLPQQRQDIPDIKNVDEALIGDFLQALANCRFFNTWTWETYPQHERIVVTPYMEEDTPAGQFGRIDGEHFTFLRIPGIK